MSRTIIGYQVSLNDGTTRNFQAKDDAAALKQAAKIGAAKKSYWILNQVEAKRGEWHVIRTVGVNLFHVMINEKERVDLNVDSVTAAWEAAKKIGESRPFSFIELKCGSNTNGSFVSTRKGRLLEQLSSFAAKSIAYEAEFV